MLNGCNDFQRCGCGSVTAVLAALLTLFLTAASARAAGTIDYDRDVLPILSDNCYKCHGPDAETRKAGLRLDTKDGAFRVKDGKTVMIPGNSAASELVRRISSTDPDEKMPPPKSLRKLTARQIQTLRAWVDQGAKWGVHWAFVAPKRPPVPPVNSVDWARNPIDHFVLARLEQEGLTPSPPASKPALLRRVSLDLTGLPPTAAELDDFLGDNSPDAYEKVVDRLLASPRYGERMASIWLDIARYADTHGYQMDRYRAMWPYRDWVIKAFNENLPFDQFATWQLAGDLLPDATKEQRLATAFNRLHMQNEEGGIVAEEFRVAYVVDRVDTFGAAFLGLTFECTRCHDHKFDPLTQKDFYSLFALFQNIDESGQTTYFTNAMPVPTLLLSDDATDKRLAELRSQIEQKQKDLQALRGAVEPDFCKWISKKGALPDMPAGLVAAYPLNQIKDNKTPNTVDPSKPGNAVESPVLVEAKAGKAAELSGENGFTFPGVGHFTRADPFSLSIALRTPTHEPRMVVLHHSKAPIDAGSRGYELLLEDGHVAFGLHHMWPGDSLKVVSKQLVPINQWTQVMVTYDGSSRAAGVHVYLDGQPTTLQVVRDGLYKDITYSDAEPDLAIGYRFRDSGFKGGQVAELRVFNRALTAIEAEQLAAMKDAPEAWAASADKLDDSQRAKLLDYYMANVCEPAAKLTHQIHELRAEENKIVNPIPEVMVMQELGHPKPAYVLKRGAYDAPGEQVHGDTPAVLPPLLPDQPHNRLGLARWLFDRRNPLTSRVTVNRLWQQMFGSGIVPTSDNFGSQGAVPSNPQLLDWLAVNFEESHWDVKGMLKQIAMSATYRQTSRCSPELLARDPDNRELARGPARRLTAEMLRDQAVFDAGLLVEKVGGPSVKPYQPDGVWDVAMGHPEYDQGHGDDLHRRSLYTFWKRSVPPPMMLTFDASDRNYCVARRQSTSTPLQALTLLNDVQITESARLISQRMLKEGGNSTGDRVAWVFHICAGRAPSGRELAILKQLFTEQRELFAADPASAKKLLAVGEARNDPSLDPIELAAGTILAEAVLNDDGAIMER